MRPEERRMVLKTLLAVVESARASDKGGTRPPRRGPSRAEEPTAREFAEKLKLVGRKTA